MSFAISKPQALLCLLCSQLSRVSQWKPFSEHHPRRLWRRESWWLLWSWSRWCPMAHLHGGIGRSREDGQCWQSIPLLLLPLFQGAVPCHACLECCSERSLQIRGKFNSQLKQTQGHHDAAAQKMVFTFCAPIQKGENVLNTAIKLQENGFLYVCCEAVW